MNHERLMTERQVAAYLAVSPDTVRRWRYAGLIPFVATGRRLVRYDPEELRQ
jgi:excisionase family DNA binding protein